jgi:transcriptional antiterminator RfaH
MNANAPFNNVDNSRWYLIYTKVKSENKAEENLERQGYNVYLPMTQIIRRRNGKNVKITEPFFSRYIFIHLNYQSDNWRPIRSTQGVASLVKFGNEPAWVPDNLIRLLKENENPMGLQNIVEKEIQAGDKVVIINGSFAGYQGIFQQQKNTERAIVLLNIVGRNTPIILRNDDFSR